MVVKVHNFFRSRSQSVVDESKLGAGVGVREHWSSWRVGGGSLVIVGGGSFYTFLKQQEIVGVCLT